MENKKRLIDVDKTKKDFNLYFGGVSHAVIANKILDEQPTMDVVPIMHGHWDIDKSFMPFISTCSECGAVYDIDGAFEWNFCPNCGAKMDGGN